MFGRACDVAVNNYCGNCSLLGVQGQGLSVRDEGWGDLRLIAQ